MAKDRDLDLNLISGNDVSWSDAQGDASLVKAVAALLGLGNQDDVLARARLTEEQVAIGTGMLARAWRNRVKASRSRAKAQGETLPWGGMSEAERAVALRCVLSVSLGGQGRAESVSALIGQRQVRQSAMRQKLKGLFGRGGGDEL